MGTARSFVNGSPNVLGMDFYNSRSVKSYSTRVPTSLNASFNAG
jgi:hypothetical protein